MTAPGRECEVGNVGCGAFYSRTLGLADWQVCGKLTGRNGSSGLNRSRGIGSPIKRKG